MFFSGRVVSWILTCSLCVALGNSRKYPYHTTDGFHILTAACLRCSTDATYINFTLPQLDTEHLNKNIAWCTCVHSEDITIKGIFVSAILNLSHRCQQSLPIPRASKMASSVKIHVMWKYWSPTKIWKTFWMHLYRNCLQRYTKCVAFLELNGIKKHVGHFPNASFRRSGDGSTRIVQVVRNINFSYFSNLIRNSATLRPLELDVQRTFCRFSSANEHEHVSDRSMLVLYPASAVVSSVVSSCFICEMILKFHKISFFKEYTPVCLLWKSQI